MNAYLVVNLGGWDMDDQAARIPVEPEAFDRWFWGDRSMERPGDTGDQRPSALQADAPPQSSPGHTIDSCGVEGHAHDMGSAEARCEQSGPLGCSPQEAGEISGTAPCRNLQAGIKPGHESIDFERPPSPTPSNAGWYRRRAEDLGDLAAELIYEGLDGTAYGQAMRAAHYGRIALDLYSQRKDEWLVTHHPSDFL